MATQTGTSTDYVDLLNDLVTFATANNWVLDRTESSTGVEERYLRGPGSATESPVYLSLRASEEAANNYYYWEIRGSSSFNTGASFESQPGTQPASCFKLLRNSTIDYWFFVSDRRIIVVAKMGTSYVSTYMGFFLPFANPREYPAPYYIASSLDQADTFTSSDVGFGSFVVPSPGNAYLRTDGGVWERVYNRSEGSVNPSTRESEGFFLGPAAGSNASNPSNVSQLDLRPPPNDPNYILTMPFTLAAADRTNGTGQPGMLEGVAWLPSHNANPEQTFTLPSQLASQTLTLTANAADGETVTVGSRTYTFQTTLTDVDGNVLIGASIADSLVNLANAINLGTGAGVTYAASTTPNTEITASSLTTTLEAVSRVTGTGPNSTATTETLANGSWGGATLAGGGVNDTWIIFNNINEVDFDSFFAIRNV